MRCQASPHGKIREIWAASPPKFAQVCHEATPGRRTIPTQPPLESIWDRTACNQRNMRERPNNKARRIKIRLDGTPAKAHVADERTKTQPHKDLIREACARETTPRQARNEAKRLETTCHHMRNHVNPLVSKLRRLPCVRAPETERAQRSRKQH